MSNEAEWGMVQSFWIDTSAYSDRDRLMFVCGVEFEMVRRMLDGRWEGSHTIHTENESRIRMMCGRRGAACSIKRLCDTWSELRIEWPGSPF